AGGEAGPDAGPAPVRRPGAVRLRAGPAALGAGLAVGLAVAVLGGAAAGPAAGAHRGAAHGRTGAERRPGPHRPAAAGVLRPPVRRRAALGLDAAGGGAAAAALPRAAGYVVRNAGGAGDPGGDRPRPRRC